MKFCQKTGRYPLSIPLTPYALSLSAGAGHALRDDLADIATIHGDKSSATLEIL